MPEISNTSKYNQIYSRLIDRAIERNLVTEYTEVHHIIPRSFGGDDRSENLVRLTLREHLVAHKLLVKMTDYDDRMVTALLLMITSRSKIFRISSREYEKLKGIYTQKLRGSFMCWDPATKVIKRIKQGGLIPSGWVKGMPSLLTDERRQKLRERMKTRDVGACIYHNPLTNETKRVMLGDEPPIGWVKGQSPQGRESFKQKIKNRKKHNRNGAVLYHNTELNEQRFFMSNSDIPINWVKGSLPLKVLEKSKMMKERYKNGYTSPSFRRH